MAEKHSTKQNPNLQSIIRAAGYTLAIYISINLIAFGWALVFDDFSGDFSIRLKYLAFSVNGELKGVSWKNDWTKIILLVVFLAFIADDFRKGKAHIRKPEE